MTPNSAEARPASGEDMQIVATSGPAHAPAAARGLAGTIAVTVRLDPERYERLKIHGARNRRTNQDILVDALDAYFAVRA
jgi:dihydrodipicolinate synthase/N-acetylneuraminate lyase